MRVVKISLLALTLLLSMPLEAQAQQQNRDANLQRKIEMRRILMEARQAERKRLRQSERSDGKVLIGERQQKEGATSRGGDSSLASGRMTVEERQALRAQIREARSAIYLQKRQ